MPLDLKNVECHFCKTRRNTYAYSLALTYPTDILPFIYINPVIFLCTTCYKKHYARVRAEAQRQIEEAGKK